MHGPLNVECQTGGNIFIAATFLQFKTEQSTQMVKRDVADSSETLIPLFPILQEKNLKKRMVRTYRYVAPFLYNVTHKLVTMTTRHTSHSHTAGEELKKTHGTYLYVCNHIFYIT
jgi:hypothetical protein